MLELPMSLCVLPSTESIIEQHLTWICKWGGHQLIYSSFGFLSDDFFLFEINQNPILTDLKKSREGVGEVKGREIDSIEFQFEIVAN